MPSDCIKIDEPMKKHTTFKIGGNADVLVLPKNKNDIISIIKICSNNDIPLITIGNGSNIIVTDKGIRGVVMKIFNNFSDINVSGQIITAQSGALLSKVSNMALENSLSGLEFAAGIPGTIGGAVSMNAGAYGGEMKDVCIRTEYLDKFGRISIIEGDSHMFGYRKSILQEKGYIVLECTLKLNNAKKENIKELMDDYNKRRREKQPLQYPSAGSIFKRPQGYFTGKLIEDCGLKGYSIGGAKVSELHGGFIINFDNATSKDVIDLIKYIKQTVKQNYNIELETEVKIIGEE